MTDAYEALPEPGLAADQDHGALLSVLFVASGAAALIYEVVWFHLLRLVIGASALSLGILLASFMGGMFLGSFLLARLVRPSANPLRIYGWLEIGIGCCGLLLPAVLPLARTVYLSLFGYGVLGMALRAGVAALLLLPPTALMGATLPAIARRFTEGDRPMSGLASLYGANTAGAVAGCLLTGFYLLPKWDVIVATAVAAAINFGIGIVALRVAPRRLPQFDDESPSSADRVRRARSRRTAYVVVGLSGMTALGAQVVWTRLLALLFGGTTYAFAIILAVFLGGLGIGSAMAASALRRSGDSRELLAACQFVLVAALVYAGEMIATVVPYSAPLRLTPITTVHVLHALRCIEVILPAAILWGMSFPMALAVASSGQSDTGRSSGNVYAANTMGAIVGALGASFVAIPSWGTRGAQQILIVAAGLSAATMYISIYRGEQSRPPSPSASPAPFFSPGVLAALALPAALVGARVVPGLPAKFQAEGRYIWGLKEGATYPLVEEGAASTVAVSVKSGQRSFHVAGKVEASTLPADMRLQRLLGHLSALVHPRPQSVLVVGLGAGVTAGAFVLHPEVSRIVICEIEPRVVPAAAQYFGAENHGVLSDPRVQVIHDDARHFLATTHEKFDVITSDPIHPWVRGNSVLFSREYYAIVKQRLRPNGVATQWVPLYETSEAAIKIQMRTFMDAFPHGTVWNSDENGKGYDVVLLGQVEEPRFDVAAVQKRIDENAPLAKSLSEAKLGTAINLFATYAASARDLDGWLSHTAPNSDFSLKLEYISGLAFNLQVADEIYANMIRRRRYPEDLFLASPEFEKELRKRIFHASVPSEPSSDPR
jgi:spermidine synthase